MREWLKNARIEKNLTMKEIGAKLGISESYYCSIENGTRQRKMDYALVAALSAILEMPIDAIAQHEKAWLSCAKSQSSESPETT